MLLTYLEGCQSHCVFGWLTFTVDLSVLNSLAFLSYGFWSILIMWLPCWRCSWLLLTSIWYLGAWDYFNQLQLKNVLVYRVWNGQFTMNVLLLSSAGKEKKKEKTSISLVFQGGWMFNLVSSWFGVQLQILTPHSRKSQNVTALNWFVKTKFSSEA